MKGSEFKALRKMLNFTQEQLAERLGLDRTSIVRFEKSVEVPDAKAKAIRILVDGIKNKTSQSEIYLEKNGVRFELVELVDHFVKNADAYFDESEYLQLWHRKKVEDLLGDRLRDLGILRQTED